MPKNNRNLCIECPDQIRGLCCYINLPIQEFNIVLENQKCPYLDDNGWCSDYKNRHKNVDYCMSGNKMFGKGALPKGCLYIQKNPKLEPNPKVRIHDIFDKLTPQSIGMYNLCNNIPFDQYIKLLHKQ